MNLIPIDELIEMWVRVNKEVLAVQDTDFSWWCKACECLHPDSKATIESLRVEFLKEEASSIGLNSPRGRFRLESLYIARGGVAFFIRNRHLRPFCAISPLFFAHSPSLFHNRLAVWVFAWCAIFLSSSGLALSSLNSSW